MVKASPSSAGRVVQRSHQRTEADRNRFGPRFEELSRLAAQAVGAGHVQTVRQRAGIRRTAVARRHPQQFGVESALLCRQTNDGVHRWRDDSRIVLRHRQFEIGVSQRKRLELFARVHSILTIHNFHSIWYSFVPFFCGFRRVLSNYSNGLNGHPLVEEFCRFLDENQCRVSHYLSFLVDRMEEMMQSNASVRPQLLPQADQVREIHSNFPFSYFINWFRFLFFGDRFYSRWPLKKIRYVENIGCSCLAISIPNFLCKTNVIRSNKSSLLVSFFVCWYFGGNFK